MSQAKRIIALLLAAITVLTLSLTSLVGCGGGGETASESESVSESTSESSSTSVQREDVLVKVETLGGMALSDVNVYAFTDTALEDMRGHGETGKDGIATLRLERGKTYYLELTNVPEGYEVQPYYTLSGNSLVITLVSSVIEDESLKGVTYTTGSVMHDFTVTDVDGNVIKLSELLKTKKMVLINFWYTTCYWCVEEFPILNEVYEEYKDEIAVVALNHSPLEGDTEDGIRLFRNDMGLTIPMARDNTGMNVAFGLKAYPTSVIVDRYGVVTMILETAFTRKPLTAICDYFTAADYKQSVDLTLDTLVPAQMPDVEMAPSEEISNAFDGGDLSVEYKPETAPNSADWSWPFAVTEKDGAVCLKSTNAGVDSSFATLYAYIDLKKGDALAFDYFASSESQADVLYVLVDRKDIYQISGNNQTDWKTCYPFVALEDGRYELAFCYYKDTSTDVGDDTVYIKNLRVVSVSDVDTPTYIPRYAANKPKDNGLGYEEYVSVVLGSDGYYHVGTPDGPILLADLMRATRFSEMGVYYMAYDGKIVLDGKDYYGDLLPYFSLASNSAIGGLCSVTEELGELLKVVALAVGLENDNPDQWLQMCCYYDAYGTDGVEFSDPIAGLSNFSAYIANEGNDNYVYYDRVIMPRGFKYLFVPERSGAYRITSDSQWEVNAWIFLEDGSQMHEWEGGERLYYDETNCSMVVYFEKGVNYYIDIAFYDVYQVGGFTFEVKYLGEEYDHFTVCAPGYFTFEENGTGSLDPDDLGDAIALGIDVMLEDGYWYEKRADGTRGSLLYAEFAAGTSIFGDKTMLDLIELGAFDFSKSETDQEILAYINLYGAENVVEKLKTEVWGEDFDAQAEIYKLDEVLRGIYHGDGEDMTEQARAYIAKMLPKTAEHPELEGVVPVDEDLGELLQMLMDKFTFKGVEHSFKKLCYYYKHLGPDTVTE